MRIIAGEFRGRLIKAPSNTRTRPTTDRVRESLFSMLVSRMGADLMGGQALDAFAGSGALGLEALSRGCSHVTFVEQDRSSLHVIRDNVATLGMEQRVHVVAGDAIALAGRGGLQGPFSLILLDPPYKLDAAQVAGLLAAVAQWGGVERGAVVSWEHATGAPATWPRGYVPVQSRRYGSTEIEIAVYEGGEGSQ